MSKAYYYLGYSSMNMNWEEIMIRSSNCIIYHDSVLDTIFPSVPNRQTIEISNSNDIIEVNEANEVNEVNEATEANDTNGSEVNESVSMRYYIITNEKILNANITYTSDYITFQDVENIVMSNDIVYIKGFLFIRRRKVLIDKMINCDCDNDFNEASSKLGLDTWKYEFYHKKFLFAKMNRLVSKNILNVVYDIKRDHPMIVFFIDFLRSCFKMVNKRIFSIILVGDTKIGKSVCFKECLINNKYIEYHNNMLEFSKCTDENKKLFRLMDDINWNTVDIMTLKSILNRNVATVFQLIQIGRAHV